MSDESSVLFNSLVHLHDKGLARIFAQKDSGEFFYVQNWGLRGEAWLESMSRMTYLETLGLKT